jgi:hypothetical protein
MDFVFPFRRCNAIYDIARYDQPLPKCEECGEELPSGDRTHWFTYRRVKLAMPDSEVSD